MADINIYGKLVNKTDEQIIAGAEQIDFQNITSEQKNKILSDLNITGASVFKGTFSTLDDLVSAVPEPNEGDYAYVYEHEGSSTDSIYIYSYNGSTWEDKGEFTTSAIKEVIQKTPNTTTIEYVIDTQGVTPPSAGWTSAIQTPTSVKPYLWTRTTIRYKGYPTISDTVTYSISKSVNIDATPTEDSTNAVSSGAVYDIEQTLQNLMSTSYSYLGIATPTSPTTPETSINGFYIASTAGTYSNFTPHSSTDDIELVDGEVAILKYSNNSWSKDTVSIMDSIPTINSKNAVISSTLNNLFTEILWTNISIDNLINGAYITSNLTWTIHANAKGYIIHVNPGELYRITANSEHTCRYTFLTNNIISAGNNAPVVTGTTQITIPLLNSTEIIIPEECNYLQFNGIYDDADYTPTLYIKRLDKLEESINISNKPITLNEWTPNTSYIIGNQIQVGSKYYRCSTAHTSDETFSVDDGWTEIIDFVNGGENYVQTVGTTSIFQSILKIDAFGTSTTGLPVGSVIYSTSSHTLRLKTSDGNKTIPYRSNCIYIYNDELYLWNGAELVSFFNNWLTDDISSSSVGYININGIEGTNSSYRRSDYISLECVNSIEIENYEGPTVYAMVAFYNENKTFISSITSDTGTIIPYKFIPKNEFPQNSKYIRISHFKSAIYRIRLNRGSSYGDTIQNLVNYFQLPKDTTFINRNIVYPIIANGTGFNYGPQIKLEGEKKYRIIFSNPSFTNSATSASYKLGIYKSDNVEGTDREAIKRWSGTDNIPLYYDIIVDSNYPYICFGSRCSVNETLTAFIIPLDALGETIEPTSITSLNPKSEFEPKMRAAKKRFYTSTITNAPAPIVIAHLSDIHSSWINVSRFLEFCNEYSSYIDLKLNTGDTVAGQFSDGIDGYNAIPGVANIINVIGNHDTNGSDGWQMYAGTQEAYDRYYANVAQWGIIQPSDIGQNDYYPCYGYKDFTMQKLRIIFLDVMAYDAVENTWLQSILTDAITNEYDVAIAAHMAGFMPNNYDIASEHINCNWTSFYGRTPGTANQTNGYNPYAYHMIESVDTFITNGGVFVGYLCGHSHYDYIAKKGIDNKQWIYTIGANKVGETRDYNHIVGTRNQDEFQIVSINTYTKTITLYKVGANVDLYGRHKNSICIDYANHQIKCEGF